jgi:YVTN family beta-propeller protein
MREFYEDRGARISILTRAGANTSMQTVQTKSHKPLSILPVLQRMQNVTWLLAFMRGIYAAIIGALAIALLRMGPAAVQDILAAALLTLTVAILVLRKVGPFPPVLGRAIAGTLRRTLGWGAACEDDPVMPIWPCILVAEILWLMSPLSAQPSSPFTLEATIPLHDVHGRIDHMAIDLPRKRLMVAELGNNTVDVIDLGTRTVAHRVSGLRAPQGVGYADRADAIVIANAGDGSVRLIDARDFSVLGRVELDDDADNVRIDPRNGLAVIGYGSGGLALIDPGSRTRVADIRLPAHPEGFQIDPSSGRTYVNIPDAHQIAVVDLDTRKLVASWPTRNASANFPMAFSPSPLLIASVFRSAPLLQLLDPVSGEVRQRLSTCGDADDVFFDPRRARMYISCGAGEIAVMEHKGTNWAALGTIQTASGARTSLFVPELDRLFVAERAGLLGSEAAIRVYRPMP